MRHYITNFRASQTTGNFIVCSIAVPLQLRKNAKAQHYMSYVAFCEGYAFAIDVVPPQRASNGENVTCKGMIMWSLMTNRELTAANPLFGTIPTRETTLNVHFYTYERRYYDLHYKIEKKTRVARFGLPKEAPFKYLCILWDMYVIIYIMHMLYKCVSVYVNISFVVYEYEHTNWNISSLRELSIVILPELNDYRCHGESNLRCYISIKDAIRNALFKINVMDACAQVF